jgi:hypothetical protein
VITAAAPGWLLRPNVDRSLLRECGDDGPGRWRWHDLCERTIGGQLEAAPDLERLQALRDAVVGYRGDPERLDRRSTSPPPEAPRAVGAEEARWAVDTARRVISEFHRAAGQDAPGWM